MTGLESRKNVPTPIDEALKESLLQKRQILPYVEQLQADLSLQLTGDYPNTSLKEEYVYESLYNFSCLKEKDIKKMSKKELAAKLNVLETEDQDSLLRNGLLSGREDEFWSFIG